MALEQNFQEPMLQYECGDDLSIKHNWKSISASTPAAENAGGCFQCNICFDPAHDPVVTLCGHLYCWPCIYEWLRVKNSAPDTGDQQKCPVCKANISPASLVPLYGHGNPSSESGTKKQSMGSVVPRRPTACGLHTLITSTTTSAHNPQPNQTFHHQQYFSHPHGSYTTPETRTLGGMGMPSVLSPTAGMFGGMVYARIFGSSDTSLFTYPYPNPYQLTGSSSSSRMRRQEMQVDKSLSRVSLFLFCCFVLCLLLF